MYLIVSDPEGRRTDAIVLAMGADRMRISVPGCDDVLELKKDGDRWIADSGAAMEIEAAIMTASGESSRFAEFVPLVRAAGGRMVS